MAGVIGLHVPLVVVERDCPILDVEREVAIGAVVVLPPAMSLLEDGIDEGLDRVAEGMRRSLDFFRIAEHRRDEFDLVRRQFREDVVARPDLDLLDLAAVAVAVEPPAPAPAPAAPTVQTVAAKGPATSVDDRERALALQGTQDSKALLKKQLEQRMNNGKASDTEIRLLIGTCKDLGDRACVQAARAALAQKQE